MFDPTFPNDAALTLSRPDEKAGTSLAKSRTWAAYALLGYAAAKISPRPDPDGPAEATTDDTGVPSGAVPASAGKEAAGPPTPPDSPDPATKKIRRPEPEAPPTEAPESIPARLRDHAKASVKRGGIQSDPAIEPRELARYCLDILSEDLLG